MKKKIQMRDLLMDVDHDQNQLGSVGQIYLRNYDISYVGGRTQFFLFISIYTKILV